MAISCNVNRINKVNNFYLHFIFICKYVSFVFMCHIYTGNHGGQTRASDLLELELRVIWAVQSGFDQQIPVLFKSSNDLNPWDIQASSLIRGIRLRMICHSHHHNQITISIHWLLKAGENGSGVKSIEALTKNWNLVFSLYIPSLLVFVGEGLSPFELTRFTFCIAIGHKIK